MLSITNNALEIGKPNIVVRRSQIDLIIGKNNKGAMVTIVERTTAMLMIRKLKKGKNAQNLANTVIDMLLPYKEVVKSITSDNGTEFAEHQK